MLDTEVENETKKKVVKVSNGYTFNLDRKIYWSSMEVQLIGLQRDKKKKKVIKNVFQREDLEKLFV